MINSGHVKNEMEQLCKFFQYDNNNSFLCNDYCEHMNSFFASEGQMYFGEKYDFDSFDKFANFPVLSPICKLSNFKKIQREYFAKGEKNRYGKNAVFKKIIKNHLHAVEKYTRKLGTGARAELPTCRKRSKKRRGENGFPIKSKNVLRKYFNIEERNSRTAKNSQNRAHVVKLNSCNGQKQSVRKIPPKEKLLHRDPQMSSDEKGKFLKRINLHFSNFESRGIDILVSPDDVKGVNGLFLLRKRQTNQLEEDPDDKSTKSEGVHRNEHFCPHDQRVHIVPYDDIEFYKLMRKRLRNKCKNAAGFPTTNRWSNTPYAKRKAIQVLCRNGSCTGGKADNKHEGDQIEDKVYTLHSPAHIQTDLERNNAVQNGNDQPFVNLGRVKYKCLNKYHSLLGYQNGCAHDRCENNKIGMAKPHCAGAAGGTTKWFSCSDRDVIFSNRQKSCGWYSTEEATPNGMNSSRMGHSNGKDALYEKVTNGNENDNKFYITSSTTCTSASKSEANPMDDICMDERKDGSVSSEQFKKIYEHGNMEERNNEHTNDIQDVGTHLFVKNMVRPLPMGESEQGGICCQSKLSENVSKLHFKHAQVEEDNLNNYQNEALISMVWDYQCGHGRMLGDRRGEFPHGRDLSPRNARVHHAERSYVSITHSQCNSNQLVSLRTKSLNEEEEKNEMENNPREGRGILGDKIPSYPFHQTNYSCKNGKIRGGTNFTILETPQLVNKKKFALKPKVYWSKRRPFWEEKNSRGSITKIKQQGRSKGTNTNYHQCGKGSLKNVEDDYAHAEKDVLTLKGGIHIRCGFAEGEKQPRRNFSLNTDSTCTLSSTSLHNRTLTNELLSPPERRTIRIRSSDGNIQNRSYTTSCINETPTIGRRKSLSVNTVSLVDANKYDTMRSRSVQSCAASIGQSSTRLSSNLARVGMPRRGEGGNSALRTGHSYDGSPLKGDHLLPHNIVEKEPPMENGSNVIFIRRSENKTELKSIYMKRLGEKTGEPFTTHREQACPWGEKHGMVRQVNNNSLYENLLTRCESPNGLFPTTNDSRGEELPMSPQKAITQNGHMWAKKGRNKSDMNSTTDRKVNKQINHFNNEDKRNIKCEPFWGSHLKWDCFTNSICSTDDTFKETEQNFTPYEYTHLGDPPRNDNLDLRGNNKIRFLSSSERGRSQNGVAISVGDLNGTSQFGKPREDDYPPDDQLQHCCYADGRLDYSCKVEDHPSSTKRCMHIPDLDQVNEKTQCVEGGCVGQQHGASYDQGGKLHSGSSHSGNSPNKTEQIDKSDYHLGRDINRDHLISGTKFPIHFFNMNEERDTKDVIAATGRNNVPPTPPHMQHFECSFANVNKGEAVSAVAAGRCGGELPNSLSSPPADALQKTSSEAFTNKSQNSYLIEWYPGFDIPIGTYGRAILRKALHQKRMTDVKMCDELLSSNGLYPTSRSTFGDMKIRDLYRAAHILGIWNVAEKYCLLACERNGYKREWIDMLKRSGVKITIKALKELRSRYLLPNKNFSISGKKKKNNNNNNNHRHARRGNIGGTDTNRAVRTKCETGIQPGDPILEASSPIPKHISHMPNFSHDDKASTTPMSSLHSAKCMRENKTSYHIEEQQSYLSTVESHKTDTKKKPNQLNCTPPRNCLHQIGIANDGRCQISSSGRVGKTDFVNTHKDNLSSTLQMSNTNIVGYTNPSNQMRVNSTSNIISKIPFGYSTQDKFSNMVVGPISGVMENAPEMSNEMSMENSNLLQNTCHFVDTNFLHAGENFILQNWDSNGTATLGDTNDNAGMTTIRGDKELHNENMPIMGDLSMYECMRNDYDLEMGMLNDMFHRGGSTSDSFHYWSNSQNGTGFVDEYM
ncbi:hypothetical protein AK88_01928 [Plasmodium fragile]|uniref:Uncharacterized protein n=1 Tax=Plasmodium fragile TaxID=5857 RepID=A0A0D9QS15_PLAFR|nr:uncharacterized protein AK88_01928 [Plasmodium fragile]KJP88476.1 hypothetical protein AK88_01928 [Plasmodium fragile]